MQDLDTSRAGSTRDIILSVPRRVVFKWTDYWSVFDRGRSSQTIPGLGVARCACAIKSFHLLHGAGIPTHFLVQIASNDILVQEFETPLREPISGRAMGKVLPLEFIWRSHLFGSLFKRVKEGKVDPQELGFKPGDEIREGVQLPQVRLECTTKFEPIDRHLSDEEAQDLAKLTESEWQEVWSLIESGVRVMNAHFEQVGLLSPDGKVEIGRYEDGTFAFVDVCGTPDENRILDITDGRVMSKDLIRNYLTEISWKADLDRAKAEYPGDKSKWPEYPELPADLVRTVSERYADVAWRYAGVYVSL